MSSRIYSLSRNDRKILSDFYAKFGPSINLTCFFTYLKQVGEDIVVLIIAFKKDRHGDLKMKPVVKGSVDSDRLYIKDIAMGAMGIKLADFEDMGIGRKKWWKYDRWGMEPYRHRTKWNFERPVVNPQVIFNHPRFKYCAWTPACGNVLTYLKTFLEFPKVELLSKIGLGKFCLNRGFLKKLDRDKQFVRFVMDRREAMTQYGLDVIYLSYKNRISFEESKKQCENKRYMEIYGLRYGFLDKLKAYEYLNRSKIEAIVYREYLDACTYLGFDMADTKNVYPISFKERSEQVFELFKARRNQERVEQLRGLELKIRKVANRFKKKEKTIGKFQFVIPRKIEQFNAEGDALENCLGQGIYAQRMADGESLIGFFRKEGKPYAAMEYDLHDRKIVQLYAFGNSQPTSHVKRLASKLMAS